MIYHLSNRQAKAIRQGNTLRVAIPAPPGGTEDPLGYARRVLPSPHIRAAETRMLTVDPQQRATGLAAVFGLILHDDQYADSLLSLNIECVVVTLAEDRPQRGRYPHQWPGAVELDDGRRLPEE